MDQWLDPGLGDYGHMDPERVRRLLFEASQMAHVGFNRHPAWLFAGEVFRVGPKVGLNLCLHAGLDPNRSVRAQSREAVGLPPLDD